MQPARTVPDSVVRIGSETPMQGVGVLSCLPAVLMELGVDCEGLLREAGLVADALDRPDGWVAVQQAVTAVRLAEERALCPHIGLLVGQRFQFGQIGLLGELILASTTVGDGLRNYAVHHRLCSQACTAFLLDYGRIAECGFAFYRAGNAGLPVVYDVLLAGLVAALRTLCGTQWSPCEVHFARSAPADLAPYRAHFRCSLRFDSDRSSVVLPADDLDRPIAGADPARFRALEQEAIDRLDANLIPLVHRSLRALLLTNEPKAARLAQQFAMHKRTLARRLRAHGTSFREVLDEVRYEVARSLLVDTRLTTADIAWSLGYSEAAPFIRAFHRWSGMSPGKWRGERRIVPPPRVPHQSEHLVQRPRELALVKRASQAPDFVRKYQERWNASFLDCPNGRECATAARQLRSTP